MKKLIFIFIFIKFLYPHPGRTDANGGHYVRTPGHGYSVGSYHYHNSGYNSMGIELDDIDISDYIFENREYTELDYSKEEYTESDYTEKEDEENFPWDSWMDKPASLFFTFSYYLPLSLKAHENRNNISDEFDYDVTEENYLWRHSYLTLGLGLHIWHGSSLSYSSIRIEIGTLVNDFDSGSEISLNNKNVGIKYRYGWAVLFIGGHYTHFNKINTLIVSYDRRTYLAGIEFGISFLYWDIINVQFSYNSAIDGIYWHLFTAINILFF